VIFDESVEKELIEDVLFSSASIPAVFPPVYIDEFELVDGGTFQNLAVGDPIERCREDGYKDEDIIVDVILCFSHVVDYQEWTLSDSIFKNALNFFERRSEIANFYSDYEDLLRITRGYPKVNFRYAVAPSLPSPS
jgi:predicted acylesterase/phospholipase RssA